MSRVHTFAQKSCQFFAQQINLESFTYTHLEGVYDVYLLMGPTIGIIQEVLKTSKVSQPILILFMHKATRLAARPMWFWQSTLSFLVAVWVKRLYTHPPPILYTFSQAGRNEINLHHSGPLRFYVVNSRRSLLARRGKDIIIRNWLHQFLEKCLPKK